MIKVGRTTHKHIDEITPGPAYAGEPNVKDYFRSALDSGLAIMETISIDDVPIVIIRGIRIWPGVFTLHAIVSDMIEEAPMSFYKRILERFESYALQLKIHRLQMVIACDQPKLIRWANFLGFKEEAILHKYGQNGEDYRMMARCF